MDSPYLSVCFCLATRLPTHGSWQSALCSPPCGQTSVRSLLWLLISTRGIGFLVKFWDNDSFAYIKRTWEEKRLVVGVFLSRAGNASAHVPHTASHERRGVTVAIPDSRGSVSERQTLRRHYKPDGNAITLGPVGPDGDRIPSASHARLFPFPTRHGND